MRSEVRILSGAMLLKIFCSGPADTNSVLIGCPDTKQAAVIDAPLGVTPHILQAIEKDSLIPQMILLTHSHWDHLADLAALKKALQVPVYVHAEDAGNVEEPGADKLPLFFPIQGVKPDHALIDGQTLSLGQLKIEVIHTPGHTPGGVCFWIPQEKIVMTGDTLFKGTIGNLSFPTARPSLMWESLKKLAKLPPDTVVIPGHGPKTSIGAEAWLSQAQELFGDSV
ncbi:MAG TPA: MBL fold metallo-hydrolase [Rhabdochlamydiaceae bacterium]|nr:MBL fold metallo-hydrolase [Rhabdochlamydiaceae bacterium]